MLHSQISCKCQQCLRLQWWTWTWWTLCQCTNGVPSNSQFSCQIWVQTSILDKWIPQTWSIQTKILPRSQTHWPEWNHWHQPKRNTKETRQLILLLNQKDTSAPTPIICTTRSQSQSSLFSKWIQQLLNPQHKWWVSKIKT